MQAKLNFINKFRRIIEPLDEAAESLTGFQMAVVFALVALIALGGIYSMFRSRPTAIGVVKDERSGTRQATITVHVAGAVATPGLYRISEGSRVADALEKAGGPLPEASLDELNLAARVTDGMKITVPDLSGAQMGSAGTPTGEEPGLVNLNTASAGLLEELPGVGQEISERIVEYRRSKGQFGSVDELDKVEGIGPGKLEKLKGLVTI